MRLSKGVLAVCFLVIGITYLQSYKVSSASDTERGSFSQPFAWERWSETVEHDTFSYALCNEHLPDEANFLTGDFNGDGRADLLCIYPITGGGFLPYLQYASHNGYSQWTQPRGNPHMVRCDTAMFVTDVQNDGLADAVCMHYRGNGENWVVAQRSIPGHASGQHAFYGPNIVEISTSATVQGNLCTTYNTGDVDGDGKPELICTYRETNGDTVTYALRLDGFNVNDWTAISPVSGPLSVNIRQCLQIHVGDIDGNGQTDIVCTYRYPSGTTATFVQLATEGEYEVSSWQRWSDFASPSFFNMDACELLEMGEIDGDGKADRICIYRYPSGSRAVWVQTDSEATEGSKYGTWVRWSPNQSNTDCTTLHAGDVNRDGLTDLLCTARYSTYSQTMVQYSTGSAYTNWQPWGEVTPHELFEINQCDSIEFDDASGDGRMDLICVYFYENSSSATFVQGAMYEVFLPIVIK